MIFLSVDVLVSWCYRQLIFKSVNVLDSWCFKSWCFSSWCSRTWCFGGAPNYFIKPYLRLCKFYHIKGLITVSLKTLSFFYCIQTVFVYCYVICSKRTVKTTRTVYSYCYKYCNYFKIILWLFRSIWYFKKLNWTKPLFFLTFKSFVLLRLKEKTPLISLSVTIH